MHLSAKTAMINAPVPKNTGLYTQILHFPPDFADLSAKACQSLGLAYLSAKTPQNAMNCAPVTEITGLYQ